MRPTPRLIAITLIGILVYLGIAIFAGGGIAAFFSHPARTALVVIVLLLAAATLFTGANLSPGEREDRENRWVIVVLGVLSLLGTFLPPYLDRKDIWTFDGDAVRWIGVAVLALGGGLRVSALFTLGERFSGLVAIQRGHRLVTDGIYRIIRHPGYLGLIVYSFGWALVFRSVAGLLVTALLVPPLIARIKAEERLLIDHFGSEYQRYRERSWRLIPRVY
jgi:protein-S-isoprenylcysteine O-methyltransferase Ste14